MTARKLVLFGIAVLLIAGLAYTILPHRGGPLLMPNPATIKGSVEVNNLTLYCGITEKTKELFSVKGRWYEQDGRPGWGTFTLQTLDPDAKEPKIVVQKRPHDVVRYDEKKDPTLGPVEEWFDYDLDGVVDDHGPYAEMNKLHDGDVCVATLKVAKLLGK